MKKKQRSIKIPKLKTGRWYHFVIVAPNGESMACHVWEPKLYINGKERRIK